MSFVALLWQSVYALGRLGVIVLWELWSELTDRPTGRAVEVRRHGYPLQLAEQQPSTRLAVGKQCVLAVLWNPTPV